MAGTIVADTIQDGAGNSTAMDNAIYGSAKAWANFTNSGSSITVRASYNVSSFTFTNAYTFIMNFTNALSDANYVVLGNTGNSGGSTTTGSIGTCTPSNSSFSNKTTTSVTLETVAFNNSNPAYFDNNVVIFR